MLVQEQKTIVFGFTSTVDGKSVSCSRNARAHSTEYVIFCVVKDARGNSEESPQVV